MLECDDLNFITKAHMVGRELNPSDHLTMCTHICEGTHTYTHIRTIHAQMHAHKINCNFKNTAFDVAKLLLLHYQNICF